MSTANFIDVTGLFADKEELSVVEFDYCIPVLSIREVVRDRETLRTVIRYKLPDELVSLAVDEKYEVVLNKIRASGSNIS